MNDSQVSPNNLLDATDCLEAIGVFRGWKNFLFAIIILSLLLTQACFWLVNTGYIKTTAESDSEIAKSVQTTASVTMGESTSVPEGPEAGSLQDTSRQETAGLSEASIREIIGEPNEPDKKAAAQEKTKGDSIFAITFEKMTVVLHFVNALLILTSILYCLTMLFSLKISLLGRLGGINHICRAFFLSLLFLILLLPWQSIFGSFVIGAMYTPAELAKGYTSHSNSSGMLPNVLYYLRFTGYWAFIVLLLLFSQLRSARWARAILRRLEII